MQMAERVHLPFWRRKFYVHPIQRKYFFLSMIPLAICAVLLILLVFAPLALSLRGAPPDGEAPAALGPLYALQGIRIWFAVLLSMLACSVQSLYVTNKFAGPLFRFEHILRRVKEGEFPHAVRIRKNDDLQEFAGLLNSAFRMIAVALRAIQEQEALADKQLGAVREKVRAGSHGEIQQGLEGIGRHLREMENILGKFRLPTLETPNPEPPKEGATAGRGRKGLS
jgi:hypothetical protein